MSATPRLNLIVTPDELALLIDATANHWADNITDIPPGIASLHDALVTIERRHFTQTTEATIHHLPETKPTLETVAYCGTYALAGAALALTILASTALVVGVGYFALEVLGWLPILAGTILAGAVVGVVNALRGRR